MKTLRFAVGLPIVLVGTFFAWLGIVITRLGYFIGGPYVDFDPLALVDDLDREIPVK